MMAVRDAHSFVRRNNCVSTTSAYWDLDEGKSLGLSTKLQRAPGSTGDNEANVKSLDRVGKAPDKSFRCVRLAEFVNFVTLDVHENHLALIHGMTVCQQEKGRPLGGFRAHN